MKPRINCIEPDLPTQPRLVRSVPLDTLVACCNECLADLVNVRCYEFASCYLWYDRSLYNDFGEEIRCLQGNTIYLCRDSSAVLTDLFHELGHVVGRHCEWISNSENGYRGHWDKANTKLIAEITAGRHWSEYLNRFAAAEENFSANAASEIWAELFMLWHLYPHSEEAGLLQDSMASLQHLLPYRPIATLSRRLQLPCDGWHND